MAISTSSDARPGTFTRGKNNGTLVCQMCGTRKQVANMAVTEGNGQGVCNPCYDRAGDENSVSDGHMTCGEFQAKYGEHSEYCDGSDKEQDMTTETTTTPTLSDDPNENAARIKAQQSAARKAAKAEAAAKVAPKTAGTSKAVKVGGKATATAKAPTTPKARKAPAAPKTPRDPGKAGIVRGLLDQGKSVRQIAQAHPEIGWSYAWDVAAAYERKLGAPGKFIASRAPGYVAPARDTTGDLPKASKAPKATPAKQAKALHVDAATGATVLTPKAPAKRAPKAKVATTTGDAAVA